MLRIINNHPLKSLNTFGIKAYTRYYVKIESENQFQELEQNPIFNENKILILGGGSNILFTHNFNGIILHVGIKGIEMLEQDNAYALVKVGAGVLWDDFVAYAIEKNLGGIENLSAIPGSVGAAPVQNIGAYGVEIKDFIEKIEGYNLPEKKFISFSADECRFEYRNSIFKNEYKNKLLITRVYFRLSKPPHALITRYRDVAEKINEMPEKNISAMRNLIIHIRESKLPDYKITGNAGSFFKNPIVSKEKASKFRDKENDIPLFTDEMGNIKLSAAWLIEKAGCKGLQIGNAATHFKQPLVLINLGNATGKEIMTLSMRIRNAVKVKFGIVLEPEVNII